MAVSSNWRNYTNDSRGNVSADGKRTFSYDFANQPISANGAVSSNYSYDGNLGSYRCITKLITENRIMRWNFVDSNLSGPIKFGMNAYNVKSELGEPTGEFKRTPNSKDIVVAYDGIGLHLVFDENELVSQLTIFPENEVFIGTIQLLGRRTDEVYEELREEGVLVQREDAGLWCSSQQSFLIEVEDVIDGVEIFRDKRE